MINIQQLGISQRKILYSNSSTFKFNLLNKSISYFNNKLEKNEFKFLSISNDIDALYNDNYYYDFLENKLIWSTNQSNVNDGYSFLNYDFLAFEQPKEKLIHASIYEKINKIYKKYFSNLSEFSLFSPIHNNFNILKYSSSNYLNIAFNTRYNMEYKIFFPFIAPTKVFARLLLNQLFVNFQKDIGDTYYTVTKNILQLPTNYFISDLKTQISTFILKNIYGTLDISENYAKEFIDEIKFFELSERFNSFIDLQLNNLFFLNYVSELHANFVDEFAFLLMTYYRDLELITFNVNEDSYLKLINFIQEELKLILNRRKDLESLTSIPYNYRNDDLQFINSMFASFSDWSDIYIRQAIANINHPFKFNTNELHSFLSNIEIPDNDLLLEHIKNNFKNDFTFSKTMENVSYKFIGQIVDNFIKSQSFKEFMLNDFIKPLTEILERRAPKLKNEIIQNIDNIINCIKYNLTIKLNSHADLPGKYRNILVSNHIDLTISQTVFSSILSNFYLPSSNVIDTYNNENIRFIRSMAVLFYLDAYVDNFRLIKKFDAIKS